MNDTTSGSNVFTAGGSSAGVGAASTAEFGANDGVGTASGTELTVDIGGGTATGADSLLRG